MLQTASQRAGFGFHSSEGIRGLAIKQSPINRVQNCSFFPTKHHLRQSFAKLSAQTVVSNNLQHADLPKVRSQVNEFITVIATVTIRRKRHQSLNERAVEHIDTVSDSAGQKVTLQLVSMEIDPKTGDGKRSNESALRDWSEKAHIRADKVQYVAEFTIRKDFGVPGAIIVQNSHQNEFYLETIVLQGLPNGRVYFPAYSWVHSKNCNSENRVVFSNHTYLPSQTPPGLKDLREREMVLIRGNGKGVRKPWERVYDYATYNDIGNVDKNRSLSRPTLGGNKDLPYPRRVRTGRLSSRTDPSVESVTEMGTNYYVPRDETFEQTKQEDFVVNSLKGAIHQLVPCLMNTFNASTNDFHSFNDIDRLYQETIEPNAFAFNETLMEMPGIPQLVQQAQDSINGITSLLHYAQPDIVSRDKFAWLRDEEFGREVLAGANPLKIERMQAFPLSSNLDPELYGPQTSAIKAEHIEHRLAGLTVEHAIDQGRLFVLDYHDAFMPFINRINSLEGRKTYASRTIFFLTEAGTLMPVAIELSLPPPAPGAAGTQRVFTPGQDSSSSWLWQLAKAHVSSNDAGFHQLVNHWLRSHAAVEPYVIATHRHLSCIHPIWKLLQPHFRYTLEINASARQLLVNADGVIEKCFTPGPYSLEISSAAYGSFWRFDQESLPADLIRRGMAVEDPSQPEGIKLVIEDYPYAADGLLIWSAIKNWVSEYVSLYYPDEQSVANDIEIQRWWDEIRNVGHGDKKDEAWWPELMKPTDLEGILTTIIWIVSGFHAAVNFGQYAYGGYVPNRPCMTRRLIPDEGTPEFKEFRQNPEKFFLSTIPNQLQATSTMAVVDTLSTHSPDEEYLGQRVQTNWTADKTAMELSAKFAASMTAIEKTIQHRNTNPQLRNRNGAGVLPYELLIPSSHPGRTARGVPNSISI